LKRDIKILIISMGFGSIAMFVVHLGSNFIEYQIAENERLTNLGTPHIVDDKGTGDKKTILLNDPSMEKNQSDISANKAWGITQGDRRIIVAVIDTGADVDHPDLKDNIWRNPGETGLDAFGNDKSTNGKDNDGNGYINDVNGWNFVDNNNKVVDHHGHGTHIAGIIGASGHNITGVCPKVSLMILKYFDPTSMKNDTTKATAKAIRYAVDMGANIINYSDGGVDSDDDEFAAVKYAEDHGVLFVAAAGNEHTDSDVSHFYPADYNLGNIISVTAINSLATVLSSSNYGTKTVHIAAPGEGIYSTFPGGKYGYLTGTSQATAFVTGVAALILSHNKDFSSEQVKRQIVATADELPGLRDKTKSGGKLNSYAALAKQPNIPATGIASAHAISKAGVIGGASEVMGDNNEMNNFIKIINRHIAEDKSDRL
jgi:thermitase